MAFGLLRLQQELRKNLVMGETHLETYRAADRNLSQLEWLRQLRTDTR